MLKKDVELRSKERLKGILQASYRYTSLRP